MLEIFHFLGCCFLRPREERTQASQKSPLLYCYSKRAPNTRLSARRPECTRRNAYLNQRFTAVYKRRSTALRICILTTVIFPVSAPGEYREEQRSTRQYATHHIQKKRNSFCIASTVDKIRFPNSPRQNTEYNCHRQAVKNAGNDSHRQSLVNDILRKVSHIQEEGKSCEKQVNNRDKDAIGDRIRIQNAIAPTSPVKTLQLKIIKEQEICLMCVRIAISASVKANTETKLIHGCPGIKA